MFIGWVRKNTFAEDLEILSQELTIDKNLVKNTVEVDQSLAFGVYEEDRLAAIVTAYQFKDSILINNLYYKKSVDQSILQRLFKILLNNINEDEKSIMFLAHKNEQAMLKEFGFEKYADFKKAVHSGSAVAFNFSNATAKSISNPNYLGTLKRVDQKVFSEDRSEYINKIISKSSSLFLSTEFGYQHSYALDNNIIKISPWIMEDAAYSDSEKLIRGILYHRGLKTILAFIPKENKEITDLFLSYKFELVDDLTLIYLNKKPSIRLESIYGF